MLDPADPDELAQGARRDLKLGIQFKQVFPEPILLLRPFPHQVVVMVQQQLDLSAGTIQLGDRKIRLPQCRTRHRQSINRVRLPPLTSHPASIRHQVGAYPQHRLAGP